MNPTAEYHRDLKHRAALVAKRERLEGLRKLYATYEQKGEVPAPGSYMLRLRKKIYATNQQLKAMAGWDLKEAKLP